MDFARGNFIDNRWIKPTGPAAVRSINPATVGRTEALDRLGPAYRIQRVGPAEWPSLRAACEALHEGVLPPPLRGDPDRFSALMSEPDAICLVVLHGAPAPAKPAAGKPTTNQATLVARASAFRGPWRARATRSTSASA